ncbi:GNAT family N-acetyltransferase [Nonomuraea sp. NPDC059194]|uniref:GNAT family N-acetyltransferase n=1 Tax=Nonomuraea sp. NPDC059194 TaxID=3346764 RepID=UPI0036A8B8BE
MPRYERRDYQGPSDLRAMQEVTRRLWTRCKRWHIGDLAWRRFERLGREPDWRTALWERDGRPVAWAWATVSGSLDLHVDPGDVELAEEIIDWYGEGGGGTVTLLDSEKELAELLQSRGYQERADGPYFIHLSLDLAGLPAPRVPEGYTLRAVRDERDAAARAAVHAAAFAPSRVTPSRVTPSRVTADSYLQVMRAWPYRTELDWLVETTEGEPVAFCLVWLDEESGVAVLEPVGTDPAHRRRGLATAAILGALHEARRLGARTARVCARGDDDYPSARATYQAMGFRPYARNVTFVPGGLR